MLQKQPSSDAGSRLMDLTSLWTLEPGCMGAVAARAGVGKTALMVQIALGQMMSEQNVLHVSLKDTVNKVSLWYQEVFRNMALQEGSHDWDALWEGLLARRFIMSFRIAGFSVPVLGERVHDLIAQGIFTPRVMIIDGIPFDGEADHSILGELKEMLACHRISAWLSVRTHRHEAVGEDGTPWQLNRIVHFFDSGVVLQPSGKQIHLQVVKGAADGGNVPAILLDPNTMLLKSDAA